MLGLNGFLASRWTIRILRLATIAVLVVFRRWWHWPRSGACAGGRDHQHLSALDPGGPTSTGRREDHRQLGRVRDALTPDGCTRGDLDGDGLCPSPGWAAAVVREMGDGRGAVRFALARAVPGSSTIPSTSSPRSPSVSPSPSWRSASSPRTRCSRSPTDEAGRPTSTSAGGAARRSATAVERPARPHRSTSSRSASPAPAARRRCGCGSRRRALNPDVPRSGSSTR